jgi:stage III sporulation protein AB
MALIVLSAAMTGVFMASGLTARVRGIEAALALLVFLRDRLRYLQHTVRDLIEAACGQPSLEQNRFLVPCRDALRRGESFPSAWQAALAAAPGPLGNEELALLSGLGASLGATDLSGQLDFLDHTRARLDSLHAAALSRRDKHQSLYSTLGVLSGVGIAIVLL